MDFLEVSNNKNFYFFKLKIIKLEIQKWLENYK